MRARYAIIAVFGCLAASFAVAKSLPPKALQQYALQQYAEINQPSDAPIKEPAPDNTPPPSVTVIDASDAHGILGRDVRTTANENMGRIVDVLVDRTGQVRAAVIDFGGFLGVGSRKIAVDWNALRFTHVANKADSIILELTREQVRKAPEYKEGMPIVVLGAAGTLEPLRFVLPMEPEK